MKKLMWMMTALMLMAGVAMAAGPYVVPLTMQEMGRYGATDALTLEAADLTVATDNVAQTNTLTLTGPLAWEYAGYVLEAPFDSTANTNVGSIAFTATLGSTTLVNARQVAQDVFRTYKAEFPVIALTNVYCGTLTNGQSATITTIMGAVPSTSPMALNEFDRGRVRVFLKILR